MVDAYNVNNWRDLFMALTVASAALIGLFFVALSVQRERLQAHAGLRFQASLSVSALTALLIGSVLGLTLQIDRHLFGAAVLVLNLGLTIFYFKGVWTLSRRWRFRYQLIRLGAVAFVLVLIYGLGLSLILGEGGGMYWLVAAVVYALPLHMLVAWNVLLGADPPAAGERGESRRTRSTTHIPHPRRADRD
jgi:hypothetical protein